MICQGQEAGKGREINPVLIFSLHCIFTVDKAKKNKGVSPPMLPDTILFCTDTGEKAYLFSIELKDSAAKTQYLSYFLKKKMYCLQV